MDEPQLHFLISAPRSGSTWLTTALNHHPELFGTEQRLFGNFCEVWKNNDGSGVPRITLDKYASAFGRHYYYQFMNRDYDSFVEDFKTSFVRFMLNFAKNRTGKRIVIDKVTPYPGTAQLVIDEIRRLFPTAKIIRLVRDGRDVLTSGVFDWLLKDAEGTERYRFFVQRESGMVLKRFFDDQVINRWAQIWRETIDVFDQNSIGDCQVTFEEMKSDFDSAVGRIFELLGIENSERVRIACREATTFKATTGRDAGDHAPTAKARKGIVGDWRNYFTQADGKLFTQLAGRQLTAAGYEPDAKWVDSLPGNLEHSNP